MKKHLIALLVFAFIAVPSFAKTPPELDGFDAFVQKAMTDFKVPGVSIAIVKNNQVIWQKGYGYRDVKKKLPVTPKTLFAIGSTTKSFTVATMGMLVDQGKLDWDKPIRDYLPDFQMYTEEATKGLTPRDLVTHRSGLPRHDVIWYTSDFSRENLIQRLRYLEMNKPIRYSFQYSNIMYMTAGYLAGKQAGSTWENAVKKMLLNPLGMEQTNFSVVDSQKSKDFAKPYQKSRKTDEVTLTEFHPLDAAGPSGSINSSALDMSNYLLFHLNRGKWRGKQLLSETSATQMQTPQIVMEGLSGFPELGATSYGMGLLISTYRGHHYVAHGGNVEGFTATFDMLPEDGNGVVVLANLSGTPLTQVVSYNALDRLLKMEPAPWSERFLNMEKQNKASEGEAKAKGYTAQVAGTKPSHALADYVGDYQHPGYGLISISKKQDKLHLTMGLKSMSLEHFHYDVFQVPDDPLEPFAKLKALFHTDKDGYISSVSLPLEILTSDIVFTRLPDRRLFDRNFLKAFVGQYEIPGAPVMLTISLRGDHTLIFSTPGSSARELVPRRGTTFDLDGLNGFQIEFKMGSDGKVTEAAMNQMGTMAVLKKKS